MLRLRFDHALAFEHDFCKRQRFVRQRCLPGLDLGEIEDLVDNRQQMPARLKNLSYVFLLGGSWRWRIGLH